MKVKDPDKYYLPAPTPEFEALRTTRTGGEEGMLTTQIPTCLDDEREIAGRWMDYVDRARGEFIISGPLADGGGPGRHFETIEEAEAWVHIRYSDCKPRAVLESFAGKRWAYVVSTKTSRNAAST